MNKQTRKIGNEAGFPRLLAEHLCLDFVNSVEDPLHDAIEFLTDFTALARWGSHTGLYSQEHAQRLILMAETQPEAAEAVFNQSLGLRDNLTNIFRAVAHHQPATEADLAALHHLYHDLLATTALERNEDGNYHWHWHGSPLQQVTWQVLQDALDLLQSGQLGRVKQCPGTGDCGWLFFDTSKNQTRQWCSMEGCGSRAKMRRQYVKTKKAVQND